MLSPDILESKFQHDLCKILDEIPHLWYFVKEAKSLRGLPDLILCYKGLFAGWELKRSAAEGRKKTGRIVLQKYKLKQVQECGGIAEVVHPDNFQEKLDELLIAGRKRGSLY